MKPKFDPINLIWLVPVLVAACVIYWGANLNNPDSRFCEYKIYKQTDGRYEVWSMGKFHHLEWSGATYAEAKAYQVQRCKEFDEFIGSKPKGRRER